MTSFTHFISFSQNLCGAKEIQHMDFFVVVVIVFFREADSAGYGPCPWANNLVSLNNLIIK